MGLLGRIVFLVYLEGISYNVPNLGLRFQRYMLVLKKKKKEKLKEVGYFTGMYSEYYLR